MSINEYQLNLSSCKSQLVQKNTLSYISYFSWAYNDNFSQGKLEQINLQNSMRQT